MDQLSPRGRPDVQLVVGGVGILQQSSAGPQLRSGGIGVASSVRPERWRHFQTHWALHFIGGAADRRSQGNRQIGPRGDEGR